MSHPARPGLEISARCACGAVTVAVNGPVLSMLICSCEDCQKATGTGHSSIAMVRQADFSIEGETRAFARPADSGATFTRYFCPQCGTHLYGRSSRWADGILLPIGLFGSDTEWFVPNQLIFARSLRGWDVVPPDLPQHETYRQREVT